MAHLTELFNVERDYNPTIMNGWTILGAGGGGSLFSPAISPHNPEVMIMTCDMTDTYITYNAGKSWTFINLDGRVDAISFDPVNEGVIYAGASSLYRSVDNGKSWNVVFPTADTIIGERFISDEAMHIFQTSKEYIPGGGRVGKILIDPSDPNSIYLACSKGIALGLQGESLMLFHTTDNCKSWELIGNFEGNIFKFIGFGSDPSMNPDAPSAKDLYMVSNKGFQKYDSATGMLIEKDIPIEATTIETGDFGYDPATGNIVMYFVAEMRFNAAGKMSSGVYRSFDFGETWTELSGLDLDFHGPANGQKRRLRSMGVCRHNPAKIYLSAWRKPDLKDLSLPEMNYGGTLTTEDFGETWNWSIKFGDEYPDNIGIGWFETDYDCDWLESGLYYYICDTNQDICLQTTMGTALLTTDNGKTWNQIYCDNFDDGSFYGKNCEGTNCHHVKFDPFNKDNIVLCFTDNGMLKSTNGGKTWRHQINGVPRDWINTCYDLVFDPEVEGRAWGVWSHWHDYPRQKLFRDGNIKKKEEGYDTMSCGGVCVTDDCAESWGPSGLFPNRFTPTTIVLDPDSPIENRTLYVTNIAGKNGGVEKSTDSGKTWTAMSNGIDPLDNHAYHVIQTPDKTLYLVNVRFGTDDELFQKGSVYKSTDGAESWTKLNIPDYVTFPNKIAHDLTNSDILYLTCWPESFETEEKFGGVYKSCDGGETWENIFDDRYHVFGVCMDPNEPNAVYITTFNHEAFRSLNGGKTWSKIDGYNFKWGQNPVIDPHNPDMLYIATFGGSVFHGPKAGCGYPAEDITPVAKRWPHQLEK
jgi:photosystem II stability/assembly factor-like uncharacterized protein